MTETMLETCPWSLSGPQFPGGHSIANVASASSKYLSSGTIQQRYCYPRGREEYSSQKGGALWTLCREDGKEDHEYRLLHVYVSPKRAANKGVPLSDETIASLKKSVKASAKKLPVPKSKRAKHTPPRQLLVPHHCQHRSPRSMPYLPSQPPPLPPPLLPPFPLPSSASMATSNSQHSRCPATTSPGRYSGAVGASSPSFSSSPISFDHTIVPPFPHGGSTSISSHPSHSSNSNHNSPNNYNGSSRQDTPWFHLPQYHNMVPYANFVSPSAYYHHAGGGHGPQMMPSAATRHPMTKQHPFRSRNTPQRIRRHPFQHHHQRVKGEDANHSTPSSSNNDMDIKSTSNDDPFREMDRAFHDVDDSVWNDDPCLGIFTKNSCSEFTPSPAPTPGMVCSHSAGSLSTAAPSSSAIGSPSANTASRSGGSHSGNSHGKSPAEDLTAHLEQVQESLRDSILASPAAEQSELVYLMSKWARRIAKDPLSPIAMPPPYLPPRGSGGGSSTASSATTATGNRTQINGNSNEAATAAV